MNAFKVARMSFLLPDDETLMLFEVYSQHVSLNITVKNFTDLKLVIWIEKLYEADTCNQFIPLSPVRLRPRPINYQKEKLPDTFSFFLVKLDISTI